jgi:hypothetical protein
MTAAANFRQADVTRALKGAEAAGVRPYSVRIDANGTIHLILDSGKAPAGAANSWDDLTRSTG